MVHVKLLHEYDEADWDRLMGVNLKGIFFSVKHGLQYLQAQADELRRERRVDQQLRRPGRDAGLHGLEVGRARADAGRSRSTTPRSGSAATASARGSPTRRCCASTWTRPRTPRRPWPNVSAAFRMRLPLSPEDIAKAVLYLSCEDSAGVTGTSLVVDGGYLAAAEWDAG